MTPGCRRLVICRAGLHHMTDANRRWKYHTRKDGTSALFSNGCLACATDKAREYKARNAAAVVAMVKRIAELEAQLAEARKTVHTKLWRRLA